MKEKSNHLIPQSPIDSTLLDANRDARETVLALLLHQGSADRHQKARIKLVVDANCEVMLKTAEKILEKLAE